MEYAYAVLILHESGEELNETNITAVLSAAGVDVEASRVKALVAALEDVAIDEVVPMTDLEEAAAERQPSDERLDTTAVDHDRPAIEGGEPADSDAESARTEAVGGE